MKLVAGLAALALAVAPAAAGAPPQHGTLVPGRSLGGLRLGAPITAVVRAWGRSFGICRGCAEPTWYFTYVPFQPQGVGASFRKGRVDALFTLWSPPGWTTTEGLVVGDAAAQVTTLYGPLDRVDCGSAYYALQLPNGPAVTSFYVVGEKVWGFGLSRAGSTPCR